MSAQALHIPLPAPPGVRGARSYREVLERLNEMSVRKTHNPYLDIAWDAAEYRLEPDAPRLGLSADHALAQTAWYGGLSQLIVEAAATETASVASF